MSDDGRAFFTVDVEATNRCNADCDFCPRDRTPHEGVMRPDVFERVLERVVEFREFTGAHVNGVTTMSFCGLGEGLLNRHLPSFVRSTVDTGIQASITSNGALLNAERSEELIAAGLRKVYVNCGELGDEYDRIYKLDFSVLHDNVVRFLELADGSRCDVYIVIVDHRQDADHVDEARRFWEDLGVRHFLGSPKLNRSGTLDVENMAFETYPEQAAARSVFHALGVEPTCIAPFAYPFIGYDGRYYLCSSDWEKKVALGDVFDDSIASIMQAKLEHVRTREPICRTCNLDPVNQLTLALRDRDRGEIDDGDVDQLADVHARYSIGLNDLLARFDHAAPPGRPHRRHIPVVAT
jgi:MoaA/NifB/PqqE/SkfB family radical SAM enzyme